MAPPPLPLFTPSPKQPPPPPWLHGPKIPAAVVMTPPNPIHAPSKPQNDPDPQRKNTNPLTAGVPGGRTRRAILGIVRLVRSLEISDPPNTKPRPSTSSSIPFNLPPVDRHQEEEETARNGKERRPGMGSPHGHTRMDRQRSRRPRPPTNGAGEADLPLRRCGCWSQPLAAAASPWLPPMDQSWGTPVLKAAATESHPGTTEAAASPELCQYIRMSPRAVPVHSHDLATITDRMEVKRAVQSGNVQEAIEKMNHLNPKILDTNPQLYFHLQQQKLIELIRAGKINEALEFAQEELAPRGQENQAFLEEIEKTVALLVFEDVKNSPYGELLDVSHRLKTASEVNAAILISQNHEKDPKLPSLLKMLIWTQDQLNEKAAYPRINNFSTAELEDPAV